MANCIIMDLGNTIIYNKDFNYNNGLKAIYGYIINPKITLDDLINLSNDLMVYYNNRGLIEIDFKKYLLYIQNYLKFDFSCSLDEIEIIFLNNCETIELIPNVIDFLDYCKEKKYDLYILSNSTFSSNALRNDLKKFDLEKYFINVISSADYFLRKPSEDLFRLAVSITKHDLDDIIYVGNDYEIDIIGANGIGLKTVWLNENKKDNNKNINCLNVNSYNELLSKIKK